MMPLFHKGDWSSERLGTLSEGTQLTSGRVWTQTQVSVFSQALELGLSPDASLGLSTPLQTWGDGEEEGPINSICWAPCLCGFGMGGSTAGSEAGTAGTLLPVC